MTDGFEEINRKLDELRARNDLKSAVFAGGCFWCIEQPFQTTDGVAEAVSGYIGGKADNPSYDQVSMGTTGHREAVEVFYDPKKLSYGDLLDVLFTHIDPTDPDGQFTDRGIQYKTAVYYGNEEEKLQAEKKIAELEKSGRYEKPIVTEVLPVQPFYPAEDYHQDFYLHSAERFDRFESMSGRREYVVKMKNVIK